MDAERIYLISDASKLVQVESHVLRYWEDELKLPVKRNELGHRYYTEEDIKEFQEIKKLKEQGLQLKAIRLILRNGKLEPLDIQNIGNAMENSSKELKEDTDDKSMRLQLLLKRLIAEVIEESNEKLYDEIAGTLTKELDYQFRMQDEREEQRENRQMLLEEEHYKQLDALLRRQKNKKTKPIKDTSKKREPLFKRLK